MIVRWLSLESSVTVGPVTIWPLDDAISRAGIFAEHLRQATSYFFDRFRFDAELRPVSPAVVFLDSNVTAEMAFAALDILGFACTAASAGTGLLYSNATTFSRFVQSLGGEPSFIAQVTRRIHGTKRDGFLVENAIEVKPAWCGQYCAPDWNFVEVLAKAIFSRKAKNLRGALSALAAATLDSDDIQADNERALYARAAMLLLHTARPRGKKVSEFDLQKQRGHDLLRPLIGAPTIRRDAKGLEYQIMRAWLDVRQDRNNFWHPDGRKKRGYGFQRQSKVHMNLIAFRALQALVVGQLVELRLLKKDDKLTLVAAAIERWIENIKSNDPRTPEEASSMTMILSQLRLVRAVQTRRAASKKSRANARHKKRKAKP